MRLPRRTASVVVALAFTVALGGCGRKGGLEPPGTVDTPPTIPMVFGTSPTATPPPEEPRKEDKPFFLDFLL